jgi:hypothetical protein
MARPRSARSSFVHTVTVRLVLAAVALATVVAPLSAQRRRLQLRTHRDAWALSLTGGGSYAISDLEIVPGVDQTGGWTWDAGLRLQRDRGSVGVGYERLRLDVGPLGTATASAVFAEPRIELGMGSRGPRPYLFAHAGRIFDYDVSFCCSVYPANSNAHGWILGGGFGLQTAPVGHIRFDLSAGVSRLSGRSPKANIGAWESAGPLMAIRLGATVPLIGPE